MDGYIRVSRKMGRQGPAYLSPQIQKDAIQRWADYRKITILTWHVDEDESGGTQDRPGLREAMRRIESKTTDGIACWRLNRFARNVSGAINDVERIHAIGGHLACVEEDIDPTGPFGRFVLTVLLAVATLERDNIVAGFVESKRRAVERGAFVGPTPVGYRRREDGTLEPDPTEATHITEAYRLAAGTGLANAAAYLAGKFPKRRWNTATIRRALSSRVYLGETRNGAFAQFGTHEPLTSKTIWEAAQVAPVNRRPKSDFPLSGRVTCATCGAHLVGSRGGSKDNRVRVYRCAATLSTFRGERCTGGPTILADTLEAFLRDRTREILSGMQVEIARPHDADRLAELEREASEAEAELAAFAGDLTARRLLGDRYHVALQSRVDDAEHKQAAYRKLASEALAEHTLPSADMLDDPVLFPLALRGIFDSITVRRGRGLAVADRVVLVEAEPDLGSGVSGPELRE